MRPDDCEWDEREVDGRRAFVPVCPRCGGDVSDIVREGDFLSRKHGDQGPDVTLCQFGWGEAYAVGTPAPPTACQAQCTTPGCFGHCVNCKDHPPRRHYCDTHGHGW